MTNFEDGVWDHLVREHGADHADFALAPTSKAAWRSKPRRLVALSASLGACVAAVVLSFTVFAGSTPAFAFTANGDGTATVSLNDIATGIPALNQLFAERGIRETVVPIEAGCTATLMRPQASDGAMSETVTVGNRWIPTGYHGFLAAIQMSDGQILLAMGTTAQPIPSCFPDTPAPRPVPIGSPTAPAGNSGLAGSNGTGTAGP